MVAIVEIDLIFQCLLNYDFIVPNFYYNSICYLNLNGFFVKF